MHSLILFLPLPCVLFFGSKSHVNRELGTTENSYWPMYFSRFIWSFYLDTSKKRINNVLLWSWRLHPCLRKKPYVGLNFLLLLKKCFKSRFRTTTPRKKKTRLWNDYRNLQHNIKHNIKSNCHLRAVWIDFSILKVIGRLMQYCAMHFLFMRHPPVSSNVQPQTTIAAMEM